MLLSYCLHAFPPPPPTLRKLRNRWKHPRNYSSKLIGVKISAHTLGNLYLYCNLAAKVHKKTENTKKTGKKRTKNKKNSIDTHFGVNGGLYWIINH